MGEKIKVAISSCLLGESVRHNGGHKSSKYCVDELGRYFQYESICPEVGIGMGVPREAIRLQGEWEAPRAIGTKSEGLDVTEELLQYGERVRDRVADCCGYILMKDSPSCGVFSTKVYNSKKGVYPKRRPGLFASKMLEMFPLLPIEESGRLNDSVLKENFITRVFLLHDWRLSVESDPSAAKLVEFHSRHKYLAMSYSQSLYKGLGQLVAGAGKGDLEGVLDGYLTLLMRESKSPPTRKGHVNALFHMLGYLKKTVPGKIRQDLTEAIEEYRKAEVPLTVPVKIMRHYLSHYGSEYIQSQSYLQPHPFELGLRNHI